jgi:hypothetical protein
MLTLRNLRITQLKQQSQLPRLRVATLCNLVPRPSNLNQVFLDRNLLPDHPHRQPSDAVDVLPFLCFTGGAAGEVRLMLSALCVCEVGAIVLVHSETETTFEAANMVFEEVGVFIEVDGFESKFAETFAAVGISLGLRGDAASAKFRTL